MQVKPFDWKDYKHCTIMLVFSDAPLKCPWGEENKIFGLSCEINADEKNDPKQMALLTNSMNLTMYKTILKLKGEEIDPSIPAKKD